MTDEELARALCRAHVEGVGGWCEGAWLAVARRAQEILCAPATPMPEAEPLPDDPAINAALSAFFRDNKWRSRGHALWAYEMRTDISAAIAAYHSALGTTAAPALPAEPAPGFVRVRIPLHINRHGVAHANCRLKEGGMEDWVTLHGYQRHIITADVPLPPAPAEIVGSVE